MPGGWFSRAADLASMDPGPSVGTPADAPTIQASAQPSFGSSLPAPLPLPTGDSLDAAESLAAQSQRMWDAAGAARVLTDRAGAIVEASRLDVVDDDLNRSARAVEELLQKLPQALLAANAPLRHLARDRADLWALAPSSGVGPDPALRRPVLRQLQRDAEATLARLAAARRLGQRAFELSEGMQRQAQSVQPVLRESDVHLVPPEESGALADETDNQGSDAGAGRFFDELDRGEPTGGAAQNTSAGCTCDPQVRCGLQGRAFTWCRVGGGRCKLLRHDNAHSLDPGGADHHLRRSEGSAEPSGAQTDRSGAVWDYCTPKATAPTGPGAPPKTAHGGVCVWDGALWNRFANDPAFQHADGSLDLTKVPTSHRLGLEAMDQYRRDPEAHGLCDVTAHSHGFAVCPSAADPAEAQLGEHGWLKTRSWDFCAAPGWRPRPEVGQLRSAREADPVAPALALPEEEGEEVPAMSFHVPPPPSQTAEDMLGVAPVAVGQDGFAAPSGQHPATLDERVGVDSGPSHGRPAGGLVLPSAVVEAGRHIFATKPVAMAVASGSQVSAPTAANALAMQLSLPAALPGAGAAGPPAAATTAATPMGPAMPTTPVVSTQTMIAPSLLLPVMQQAARSMRPGSTRSCRPTSTRCRLLKARRFELLCSFLPEVGVG